RERIIAGHKLIDVPGIRRLLVTSPRGCLNRPRLPQRLEISDRFFREPPTGSAAAVRAYIDSFQLSAPHPVQHGSFRNSESLLDRFYVVVHRAPRFTSKHPGTSR